jgi:phage terminase small subunit
MSESAKILEMPGIYPDPPEHLSEGSKRRWCEMHRENHFDAAALPILISYLTAIDRVEVARKEIMRLGPVVVDRFNQIKPNPYCAVERDNTLIMHRAFRLLGFDQEPRGGGEQGSLF